MDAYTTPVPFLDSTDKPLPRPSKIIRPGTCAAVFTERGEILLQKRSDNGGGIVPNASLCCVCARVSGTLQLSDESTDLGYFPLEALPEPMMPAHLIRLKDVLAQQRQSFMR